MVDSAELPGEPRALPGAVLHCALLTVLTVALAALTGSPETEALLRPLFFALLFSFFRATGKRHPQIRGLPMRLGETGFLVLTLASVGTAVILLADIDPAPRWLEQLQLVFDRGAIFVLGLVLLAYGLLQWIPLVLESHRKLQHRLIQTRDALEQSESARTHMEQRLVDFHRLCMLGELAAGVAHDLRKPLTTVKDAAEGLLRRQSSPATTTERAEIICRGVEQADRTIQTLIDLERPHRTSGSSIDLADLAREVLALVDEGRRRNLRFVADLDGRVVSANRDRLAQVLLNLVLNAAQASPLRGTIELCARSCRRGDRHWLGIAVEDRGPGLSPELRQQLFTPFSTTRRGGIGLGLPSSQKLMNEMGGSLGLYPRTRGGTRALLLLPIATARQQPPELVPLALGGSRSGHDRAAANSRSRTVSHR